MSRAGGLLLAGSCALLWWILTGGDPASWIIGVPAVLSAVLLSRALGSFEPARVSPVALVKYLAYFAAESVKGGMDVARRALLPGTNTSPHFLQYRTSLPAGWPRSLFANTVSLMPGTLTADMNDDRITLHALAADMRPLESVRACERKIAAVFRVPAGTGVEHHG